MSDDSLFEKHMRLIEGDKSTWSKEDHAEAERLNSLHLPPLDLKPKPSFWQQFKFEIQIGLAATATAALAIVLVMNKENARLHDEGGLTAKGSLQVQVIWERAGKVSPLTSDTVLKDGDKVGASVVSSDEAVAYWSITDDKFKSISDASDIESSKIALSPGARKSFASSFELVAPNQGENLVVVVCPKSETSPEKVPMESLMDHGFIAKLNTEPRIRSSNCVFVGYRLRRLP